MKDWQLLPGSTGIPYIGDSLALVTNPWRFAQARYEKYGPVSKLVVLGKPSVLLLGPDANELLVKDKERIFSSIQAYEPFIGQLFPGTLGMKDFEDHAYHRRILQVAFHKKSLKGYIEILHKITAQQLNEWDTGKPFAFFYRVKDLLLQQAAAMFLGQELDSKAHELGEDFLNQVNAATSIIRLPIPGTPYWKGLRSKDKLWKFLESKLSDKRSSNTQDLFSQVCHSVTENGETLKDNEVVGHMLGLMSAAHDTNTSSISSMVYALAKNQVIQNQVRDELLNKSPDEPDFEILREMTLTNNVFKEALRLWGPSHTLPRGVLKDFEFSGYKIPAGTMAYLSPSFTHRMEEYWHAPEEFSPGRFEGDKDESKQHKFLFMPFGGGAHACVGMVLAEIQTKVFFWHLLSRYKIDLVTKEQPYILSYNPLPIPKDGLKVKLSKLN